MAEDKEKKTFSVDWDGKIFSLFYGGFTSMANLHNHYMKHVARINETQQDEAADPEKWYDIWPEEPKLKSDLNQRRKHHIRKLKACLPPCNLARRAPSSAQVCVHCVDQNSRKAVEHQFLKYFQAYEDLIKDAFHSTLGDVDQRERRFWFLEPGKRRNNFVLHLLSKDKIYAIFSFEMREEACYTITGFRTSLGGRLLSHREAHGYFLQQRRRSLVQAQQAKTGWDPTRRSS